MDTNGHPRIGELLRAHRKRRGLTQKQLADLSGVSVNAIGAIESGASGASRGTRQGTVEALASALELDETQCKQLIAARRLSTPLVEASAPDAQRPGVLQLIGRSAEQMQIQRLLQGDGPPMLAFYGEPGVGKTRLLIEAEDQARRAGWTPLVGGSQQADGQHPYTPLFQALERHIATQRPDELRQALQGCEMMTRLLPELAKLAPLPEPSWRVPAEQERRLIFTAIGRFLATIGEMRGVVLILDDLQWAEPDGLLLLATLLRSANDGRQPRQWLRVVAASHEMTLENDHPLRRLRQDLARDHLASWIRLTPLDLEHSETLLRKALEDVTLESFDQREILIRKTLARSGGMPLFLTSFAHEICDYATSGRGAPMDDNVPWNVAELTRKRIQALPETTRELLTVAAVYGRETPLYVLALASDLSERDIIEAVETACAQYLLVETENATCAFRHDLIRDVILTDLSAMRRQMLHRRIVDMLEPSDQQGHIEPLAFHSRASADVRRAVRYLEQAGDVAQTLRADVAANARYEDALHMLASSEDDMTIARLHAKRGAIVMAGGDYDLALDCFESMARSYEQIDHIDGVGQAAAQIGWAHVRRGSSQEGLARIAPLLAPDMLARMTPSTQAALLCAQAVLLFAVSRYAEQLQSARRACDLARAAGDQAALARGMRLQGLALVCLARLDQAAPVLEETMRVAEAVRDLDSYSAALNDASAVMRARGDIRASWRYSEQALVAIEQLGDPMGAAFFTASHGDNAFLLGDWRAARRWYERGVRIVREMGESWAASYPLADLGYLNLLEGHDETSRALLREALTRAESHDDKQALRHVHGILAERDMMAGAALEAVTRLQPLIDVGNGGDVAEKESTALLPLLARAHIALGRNDQAASLLAFCRRQVEVTGAWLVWADAQLSLALLHLHNGDLTQAAVEAQQAAARAQDMGYLYGEAKALALRGYLHSQRNDRAAARDSVSAALAIYDRLGEHFYSRQAANLLQRINSNAAS
ncbi:MAG TPA: AAA family ATPase [Ktedonobacterales bacterium]|nr:AAA family ATPase [Ktedonobacterales bacterium]